MGEKRTTHRGGWAYVSLVSTLPGLSIDPRLALVIQLVVFEGVAVGLALWYDLWRALPVATVAIAIATAGSGLMGTLSARIRELSPPGPYRRLLFLSSVDIAMGLGAFIALVTYLLVQGNGPDGGFLVRYLGEPLPPLGVGFALLVSWDLSYRIGTAWWASITGLWRTFAFRSTFDRRTRTGYVRVEMLTIAFAGLHVFLVPFLWADQLLAVGVIGHVGAVVAVSSLSIGLLLHR